jgi:hypothetical protein
MSKEGSLARIEIYKEHNNLELLKVEEEFYNKTYGTPVVKEEPKVEKIKKSK